MKSLWSVILIILIGLGAIITLFQKSYRDEARYEDLRKTAIAGVLHTTSDRLITTDAVTQMLGSDVAKSYFPEAEAISKLPPKDQDEYYRNRLPSVELAMRKVFAPYEPVNPGTVFLWMLIWCAFSPPFERLSQGLWSKGLQWEREKWSKSYDKAQEATDLSGGPDSGLV